MVKYPSKQTSMCIHPQIFYMLCKHPQVDEKVGKEVRRVTNTKWEANSAEIAACLSEQSLKKMHYLHAALTETLRLYPAIP